MTEQKRGRGRPRRAGADDEILSVAFDMLRKDGLRDLSVDAIAERTGMAKTTIYRRWPSKAALAAAAIESLAPVPESASPGELLEEMASTLTMLRTSDGETFEVLTHLLPSRRALLVEAFTPSRDATTRADMLLGALLMRFVTAEPVTTEFVQSLARSE